MDRIRLARTQPTTAEPGPPAARAPGAAPAMRVLPVLLDVLSRMAWLAALMGTLWYFRPANGALPAELRRYLWDTWARLAFQLYASPYTHGLYLLLADWLS